MSSRINLFCLDILNFPWGKNVPICIHASRIPFPIVNQDTICCIRPKNECVEMCKLVCFTFQVLLERVILALVGEYNMELFCLRATYIWSKYQTVPRKQKRNVRNKKKGKEQINTPVVPKIEATSG